jgi:hypothetical protein
MSLNKEMIFGLSFGGDNMKMLVPNKSDNTLIRGNATPYTFNTPVVIHRISNVDSQYDNIEYTITYPDGSTLTANVHDISINSLYFPEGTKFEFKSRVSANLLYYLECKWIDV